MNTRVNELLNQMTIDEKIAQMSALFSDVVLNEDNEEHLNTLNLDKESVFALGAISGVTEAHLAKKVIDLFMEKSRLKIPPLMMVDVIHGYQIHYPNANALGCMFDENLVYELTKMSAKEASINGVNLTYSPMADMTNDPRWGRIMEMPSEDVYLNEQYLKSIVNGFQNETTHSLVSCVKHLAGYGLAEGGRDYDTCDASPISMYNKYLTGYRAAIKAGAKMAMTSFNVYDYVPSTVNEKLLKTIVRKEMDFDGVIISDHSSIEQVVEHGVAKDAKEAAMLAIKASVDMELATSTYTKYLHELLDEGKIDISQINDSVLRILTLKEEMGLFDNPYMGLNLDEEKSIREDKNSLELVKKAAVKSTVLLKNTILPLDESQGDVVLTGPLANTNRLVGFNGCSEKSETTNKLSEVFSSAKLVDGLDYTNNSDDLISDLVEKVGVGKTVIMAMGEYYRHSGEGVSQASITIEDTQVKYIKEVAKNNKVVLIVFSGRPLDLSNIINDVDDILFTWFGGSRQADALYDLVFGIENPSGKLSYSFPRNVGQIPVYYNKLNTGRPVTREYAEYESTYRDEMVAPLFEFGYGLSYSEFDIKFSTKDMKMNKDEILNIDVVVSNTSSVDGEEVVQLYIRDNVASISRPIKELKAYKKVFVKAYDSVEIKFEISKEMFEFYNSSLEKVIEDGDFTCFIGNSSINNESFTITYTGE